MNHFHRYDEIIHLPHPVSQTHPRMGRLERAAQFSPFAALTGYDDAVRETARLTDAQRELAEDEQALLERQLLRVQMLLDATRGCRHLVPARCQKTGRGVCDGEGQGAEDRRVWRRAFTGGRREDTDFGSHRHSTL